MDSFRLNKTIDIVKKMLPFLESSINESRVSFGERFEQIGEDLCACLFSVCDKDESRYVEAVKGYVKFCVDHLRLQKRLEKDGHYLHNNFETVSNEVYNNTDLMNDYYLSGLFLSTLFWPNHLRMFLFFIDKFVKNIAKGGRCCEIGIGHGLLMSTLLKKRMDIKVLGVDISHSALVFTEKILMESRINKMNYDLKLCDVRNGIPSGDGVYDAVIFGEILEHLDNPNNVMREVVRIVKPGGILYITAAIYAANVDHIYLFESANDVKVLITNSGLKIKEELILPVYSYNSATDKKIPINYACIAEKSII